MKAKRIIAFLILQVYLVAAFGLTFNANICCEEKPTSEVAHACHQDKVTESSSLKEQHPDCIFCNKESEPSKTESCCDDCSQLKIVVAENSKLNVVATPSVKSIQKENYQPISFERFGLNPNFFEEIHLLTTPLSQGDKKVKSHSIPLYIKNCIYRI